MLLKHFTATALLAVAGTVESFQSSDLQDLSTVIITQPDEGAATLVKASYGDDIDYCFAQLLGAWGCTDISDSPLGKYKDGTCVPLSKFDNYHFLHNVTLTNLFMLKMRAIPMRSLQSATRPRSLSSMMTFLLKTLSLLIPSKSISIGSLTHQRPASYISSMPTTGEKCGLRFNNKTLRCQRATCWGWLLLYISISTSRAPIPMILHLTIMSWYEMQFI